MQIIKSLIRLLVLIFPFFSFAQSTYLPEGSKEYNFIDRLEIKQEKNTDINYSTIKPYIRKDLVKEAEYIDSMRLSNTTSASHLNFSKVDEYNLRSLFMDNSEWVTGSKESFASKKPVLKTFYKTPTNFFEVNTKDFFLVINPLLNLGLGKENNSDETIFLNTRGVTLRGLIADKIGFSASLADNQERGPEFFRDRITQFRAVPGVGFYKTFKKTAVDYFDARGYITFNATKYINFQFGYDKNFIGNGYRSMFLSDWGDSYLFLKINTRIWKFNYENIFMELIPEFVKSGDNLLDRKYAAMHHLSMNVTKTINVGLFEGVIFGRKNRYDFEYLNPIIFYRHIEGTVGSPDNAVAGIDVKANILHRVQFYSQFLLDEFILNQITKSDGYWANKYGFQAGLKYVDAFTIKNLDLQVETNLARPFTYQHNDSVGNYTHYNQPLAHPLGGNFFEFVGIIKYQPLPKWYLYARAIAFKQGLDSAGANFGSSPFELYTTRTKNYGYTIGSGNRATNLNAYFALSYEIWQNIFIEGSLLYRNYKVASIPNENKTTLINLGLRVNMFRREYDF